MLVMDPIHKKVRFGELYDTYGSLLTPKQQRIMEAYFYEDLSLGEIGENTGSSRQAVYDLLKRVEKSLEGYEARLHVLQQRDDIHEKLRNALALLDTSGDGSRQEVKKILQELLDESR